MLARLFPGFATVLCNSQGHLVPIASLDHHPCVAVDGLRPLSACSVHVLGFSAGSLCALSVERLLRLQAVRAGLCLPLGECRVASLACPPDLLMQLVSPRAQPVALLARLRRLSVLHVWGDKLCRWHPTGELWQQLLIEFAHLTCAPLVTFRLLTGETQWLGADPHNYSHLLSSELLDQPRLFPRVLPKEEVRDFALYLLTWVTKAS